MANDSLPEQSTSERVWRKIFQATLALPGAKVNRDEFLWSQLWNRCEASQVREAIDTRPATAGIPIELVDELADACIRGHVVKASSISFLTGIPGGLAMAATIPADIAQFYWHALVLAQKLAYLYGWQDLLKEGEVDEDTEFQLTLLIGTMMGASAARRGLVDLSERLAVQIAHRLPRQPLTKYAVYNLTKRVGTWIGVRITKGTFSRGVAKVIPFIGAAISAGVTATMMLPMAKALKNHLRRLRLAHSEEYQQSVTIIDD